MQEPLTFLLRAKRREGRARRGGVGEVYGWRGKVERLQDKLLSTHRSLLWAVICLLVQEFVFVLNLDSRSHSAFQRRTGRIWWKLVSGLLQSLSARPYVSLPPPASSIHLFSWWTCSFTCFLCGRPPAFCSSVPQLESSPAAASPPVSLPDSFPYLWLARQSM